MFIFFSKTILPPRLQALHEKARASISENKFSPLLFSVSIVLLEGFP
jgi:hypothetical protein